MKTFDFCIYKSYYVIRKVVRFLKKDKILHIRISKKRLDKLLWLVQHFGTNKTTVIENMIDNDFKFIQEMDFGKKEVSK